jgi:hypothetical protein
MMDPFDKECPRCAKLATQPPTPKQEPMPPPPKPPVTERHEVVFKDESRRRLPLGVIVAGLGIVGFLVILFGKFHIVQSEDGTEVIPKIHFTFSETFVSLDAITGMPFVKAKEKYPLAVKALQREGILETDEAFEARIKAETEAEMREAQDKAMQDFNERMRQSGY